MRYIRFLKTPRIVTEKGTGKSQIHCLVTITSDLGDSFFPFDAELVAELINSQDDHILVWRTVAWVGGMRTLAITLPLKKSYASRPLRMRVGIEQKAQYDTFENLCQAESQGIVSAWSAEFNPNGVKEAVKLVERRFKVAQRVMSVWEETGESIARHLWDAGITLSCRMADLESKETELCKALNFTAHDSDSGASLKVLELGTGCGIVGMTLASVVPNCNVHLSDLPEAREIIERNIIYYSLQLTNGSKLTFEELDWDNELPARPALVNTLRRLADINNTLVVGIAMKMRHDSERVFFDLMAEAGFKETALLEYPLPGDLALGEDTVYLHVYRYAP
ncbi:hypothetical protein E8E12_005118 [Didymella heteroderae]|uniref:Uncharacterized protein n=1 Tax=Didymella heteroderae TaxID=1769908 RepID=A0A9P4WQN1_9PLEO|nr:hypothetical protein E8E12_005118 [Didymella heteroderae]